MLTAYSRVTVVTAERTIDLALPSGLPLSEVLPQVMRFASPEHKEGAPTSWTLARLGSASLSLTQSLAEAGVLDGDVLELRGQQEDVRPALVEDVRDAVEDSVDDAGGVWTTRTTGSFAVQAGATLLGVLALASLTSQLFGSPSWIGQVDPPGAATGAVVGLLFATWWAERFARPVDAAAAALSAMLWGALLGRAAVTGLDVQPWTELACALLGLAVVAGAAVLITRAAIGHAAAAAVLGAAALIHAAVGWLDLPVGQAVRVLPVLALLSVGIIPRVSLSVGGLASADYRVRHVGRLGLTVLRARYRASNALLVGSLIGVALLVVWGSVILDVRGDEWDRTLALSLAVAALLRSRLFSRSQHMLPLRIAGLGVLGFALTRYAVEHTDLIAWLAPIGALALVAGVSVAGIPISEITRARIKRTLNIIEFLVIVDLLVVLAGSLGVYGSLGGIF